VTEGAVPIFDDDVEVSTCSFDLQTQQTPSKSKLLLLLSTEFNVISTTGLLHHYWSSHYLNGNRLLIETLSGHMSEDTDEGNGFDLVLKELMLFQEDGDSNRPGFGRVLKTLISEREKQQSELLKQQEEFQLKLQRQQEKFQAKIEEEIKEERRRHAKERSRQDQERRDALQQQERQQIFFRHVIQQLQDEVKVLRHSESAHLISGTQGEVETPGGYKTPASSSPYSMTPLSLMMETPSKPFEDSIGGGEVVENFAAGGRSGSVDETNNYVENDAVEEEEPTSIIKSDQGSVVLSDEDQRAKGLISFEESFLLNKSDQVGNKVENAEKEKPPKQMIASRKSGILKKSKEKMKMIAGKQAKK